MPQLDTPITTDSAGLERVLAQPVPVLLVLHDGKLAPPLAEALSDLAASNAGSLLVARVDAAAHPQVHAHYDSPIVPALLTLTPGPQGRVKSRAERISAADLRAHTRHLLEDAPLPEKKPSRQAAPGKSQRPVRNRPIDVTDRSFKREVLGSDVPVLVDFWAPWCGPCRAVAPHVEQIASQYAGRVKVAKLNTDQNPRTAGQFDVRAIPTFMVFVNGKAVERFSGANPATLRRMVQNHAR